MNEIYITLTDENFELEVIQRRQTYLVEFGVRWCGTCHLLAPILEDLYERFGSELHWGKMDLDENRDIPHRYGVNRRPTYIFFRNGEPVDSIEGAVPKSILEAKLRALLEGE